VARAATTRRELIRRLPTGKLLTRRPIFGRIFLSLLRGDFRTKGAQYGTGTFAFASWGEFSGAVREKIFKHLLGNDLIDRVLSGSRRGRVSGSCGGLPPHSRLSVSKSSKQVS